MQQLSAGQLLCVAILDQYALPRAVTLPPTGTRHPAPFLVIDARLITSANWSVDHRRVPPSSHSTHTFPGPLASITRRDMPGYTTGAWSTAASPSGFLVPDLASAFVVTIRSTTAITTG
ncbi:hypothetical protein E4U55_007955 [Claviceps digitariae]|nr:hypothetical protein E4U55_007955 [Claviceps digitariae]